MAAQMASYSLLLLAVMAQTQAWQAPALAPSVRGIFAVCGPCSGARSLLSPISVFSPHSCAQRRGRTHVGLYAREERGVGAANVRYEGPGFRVVKCFPELARRQADQAVQKGRVTVNGERVEASRRLRAGDMLTLDGKPVEWESRAVALEQAGASDKLVYFKYHKPAGVASSWDKNDRSSLLHFIPANLLTRKGGGEGQAIPGKILTKNLMEMRRQQEMATYKGKRLFPVGRLDKDSTGLMLLTDDGRVVNALLQPRASKDKEYLVQVDRRVPPSDVLRLAAGVEISTAQQRGPSAFVTALTLPCLVEKIEDDSSDVGLDDGQEAASSDPEVDGWERGRRRGRGGGKGRRLERARAEHRGARDRRQALRGDTLRFVLREGRNRQIRKMLESLGYGVVSLERVRLGEIELGDLPVGAAAPLTNDERLSLLANVDEARALQGARGGRGRGRGRDVRFRGARGGGRGRRGDGVGSWRR